jgi:hypothetical protein
MNERDCFEWDGDDSDLEEPVANDVRGPSALIVVAGTVLAIVLASILMRCSGAA